MASLSSTSSRTVLVCAFVLATFMVASAGNLYNNFDITWGDGRAKIINNGDLLTLSLDKASGSGFQSKNEYLFGKIDMQLKLVPRNSAGTVTAYYVSFLQHASILISILINIQISDVLFLFGIFSCPQKAQTGMR